MVAIRGVYEVAIRVKDLQRSEWMPATSVYFTDPDGHALELCAPVSRA